MKRNWFETWILTPLLAPPAIILDPFTFYSSELVESADSDAPLFEDSSDAQSEPTRIEGSR